MRPNGDMVSYRQVMSTRMVMLALVARSLANIMLLNSFLGKGSSVLDQSRNAMMRYSLHADNCMFMVFCIMLEIHWMLRTATDVLIFLFFSSSDQKYDGKYTQREFLHLNRNAGDVYSEMIDFLPTPCSV